MTHLSHRAVHLSLSWAQPQAADPRPQPDGPGFTEDPGWGCREAVRLWYYCPDLRGHLSETPTRGNEIVRQHFSHQYPYLDGKEGCVCVWRRVCVIFTNSCVCVCVYLSVFHSMTSEHMDNVCTILWLDYESMKYVQILCWKKNRWQEGRGGWEIQKRKQHQGRHFKKSVHNWFWWKDEEMVIFLHWLGKSYNVEKLKVSSPVSLLSRSTQEIVPMYTKRYTRMFITELWEQQKL